MEKVKLRWIEVDAVVADTLLLEAIGGEERSVGLKDRVLRLPGIERRDGESHLRAWLRAMAEENGLPVQLPAHCRLKDVILETVGAARFAFWLA